MIRTACVLLLLALGSDLRGTERSELQVSTDFPGGSAEVVVIDQVARSIHIAPAKHRDRGWVCWWYFRLDGIEPGETITVEVGPAPWATPDRATFSLDGERWQQTSAGKRDGRRIRYQQQIDARRAWFAWGPPFVPVEAERLAHRLSAATPHAERFNLATTRGDHETPAVRISDHNVPNSRKQAVWIQARQHAWESGSSWVAKGAAEWINGDDPLAGRFRKAAIVTVVPIMDIDNVHRGAGGKEQVPHDHNRDWTDEPHWRAVAAAQHEMKKYAEDGRLSLFIDLHNPGANDREPFFYIPPDELLKDAGQENLKRFLSLAKQEMTGPLGFRGKTRVSGAGYDKRWKAISKNWVSLNGGDGVVAVTLETSWNTPHSTTENYERIGRELAKAVAIYVANPNEEPNHSE